MPFAVGQHVRIRNRPAEAGEVLEIVDMGDPGGPWYRVRFAKGVRSVAETSLMEAGINLPPLGAKNSLQWGRAVPAVMRCVALEWHSVPIHTVDGAVSHAEMLESVGEHCGVYAFEGKHDAFPGGAILYVGLARGKGTSDRNAPLRKRIPDTFKRFAYRDTPRGQQRAFADCWDLVFHWAKADPGLIDDVESVLIRAHAPPFNAQEVRGELDFTDLVVLNAGAKGRLIPVVSSLWHASDAWPESAGD